MANVMLPKSADLVALPANKRMASNKQRQYNELVQSRKQCRACAGLKNPACRGFNKFDSDEIGPWSRLHGDLNAKLMIVGQDWGGQQYYRDFKGLDDLDNPTMNNLQHLLAKIGMDVSTTTYAPQKRGLFLTNAILCLKSGGLQAKIDRSWLANCGERFLRKQIEIVSPKIVVGLGSDAFNAILVSFGQKEMKLSDAILDKSGVPLSSTTRLFAAYHCGAGTINRNRDLKTQTRDWNRIGLALRAETGA